MENLLEDKLLLNALSNCPELSDFWDDEYDLSNPEFVEALGKVKTLILKKYRTPVTEQTVEELKQILGKMSSIKILNIISEGENRQDVSAIFDSLGESIEKINLKNVNIDTPIALDEEKYRNLTYFFVEGSNLSQIPEVANPDCLITLGKDLPNISDNQCIQAAFHGQKLNLTNNEEVKSLIQAFRSGQSLPLEVYEKYSAYIPLFGDKDITIAIPDVGALDKEKLEQLTKNPHIKYIDIQNGCFDEKRNHDYHYSVQEYAAIRGEIDEIVSKVVVPDISDKDREKKIFAQIYVLLGEKISYDHYAISEEGKKDPQLTIDCRNLKNALLGVERNGETQYQCVCAGYADVLRNVASCFGIQGQFVKSRSEIDLEDMGGWYREKKNSQGNYMYQNGTDDPMGHAYNLFELDGQKYYCDLTWDAGYIKQHQMPLPNFLRSYDEFIESHAETGFTEHIADPEARKSYPYEQQASLLKGTKMYQQFEVQSQIQELNQLMRQNYLCGFVSDYVDFVRNGRSAITVEEVRQIFMTIGQVENAILTHRGWTDKQINYESGENPKSFTFQTSEAKTLEKMRSQIKQRRERRENNGQDER
ncbi:MAG: hypothetical protein IJ215_03580 [Clostridia bacterium]|nr:hypothetical protein [Clostridia bacterium]